MRSDRGGLALIEATGSERGARWALGVFVAYVCVAFLVLLIGFGRWRWFAGDEWGFIVGKSLGDVGGLFEPLNSHWSTVPTVAYQVLFQVFGLNTYLPYVGLAIVLHLTLAVLLRVVMRRAGVGPWVATVVAATFVLFGTGQENILNGVQINMLGSMVLGTTHLLLADHDGSRGRRDALGLAAGALGVMSSGIGVPMVAVVGLAVLIRRGWRAALLHTLPLAALYGGWLLWQASNVGASSPGKVPVSALVQWVNDAAVAVFLGLGQYRLVAVGLGVVLVVGLVLAWGRLELNVLRRRAAVPAAMLAGGVLLVALAASQRYEAGNLATSSRYVSMVTALSLPALGVAAGAVIQRWRLTAPLVLGLFIVGVPGNISVFSDTDGLSGRSYFQAQRALVLGAAHSPVAEVVPRDVHPNPGEFHADLVTVGFLLDARSDGKVPDRPELTSKEQALVDTRLIVSQGRYEDGEPDATCRVHRDPLLLRPAAGQQYVLGSAVRISRQTSPDTFTVPARYNTLWSGRALTVELPDQTLLVEPSIGEPSFTWCTAAAP